MNSYWLAMLGAEVRYPRIGEVRTRILESGDESAGRVVLLVHGSGGHAENFVTNMVALGEAGHAIAPDLLGHGLNSRPANADYTMRGVLNHLTELLGELRPESVSAIGLSLGGALVCHLARELPELIDKVVMICPSGLWPGEHDPALITEAAARMRDGTKNAIEDPTLEKCRQRLEHLLSDPSRLPEEMVYLRQYMYTRPGAETMIRILDDNVANAARYAIDDEILSGIEAESLIVWGRHNATPLSTAEEACARLKHGELFVLEDSGHWPHYEEQEAFHKKVLNFLGP